MKKILLALFFIAASLQLSLAKDKISHDYESLPQTAKEFISNYFADKEFSYMKIEGKFDRRDYDVYFTSGTMIEFNHKGEWKEIKSKKETIPTKYLPVQIPNYISQNYPNQKIYKIEKKSYGYEIELNNDLDLIFDKNGAFKKIDK